MLTFLISPSDIAGKHSQFGRVRNKSGRFRGPRQHREARFDVWIPADTVGESDRLLRHFNLPVTVFTPPLYTTVRSERQYLF